MDISKVTKELMLKEPFYGLMLLQLNKVENKSIDTACVRKAGYNLNLEFNPDFYNSLSYEHQYGLLKHELLHIAFHHLYNFDSHENQRMVNIAADIEINQYIEEKHLPPGALLPSSFPDFNLPEKAGTQTYYDILMKEYNTVQQGNSPIQSPSQPGNGTPGNGSGDGDGDDGDGNGSGSGSGLNPSQQKLKDMMDGDGEFVDGMLDDHGSWKEIAELSEADKKIIKNQVEHQLKEVVTQLDRKGSNGRGSLPASLQQMLEELFKEVKPVIDWKAYLRNFVSSSNKIETKKTRHKPNIRFNGNPALKIKPRKNMLVAIDTSGSVSTEEMANFMAQIKLIHKTGTDITILHCDADVDHVEEYKGKFINIVYGGGGTNFTPAVEWFNKNQQKYNCMVYFTDGECPAPKIKPKKNMLWVLTRERKGYGDQLPGKEVRMEVI
jgi:predicted metal-dependent peptidase